MSKDQRIWSRKVLKVVEFYNHNQKAFLFGITGDLDNLGIFVSQHGRPLAENLVDAYNRLIGAFMYEFVEKHSKKIPAFCMIPSGEEIFAIGVANNRAIVNEFFFLLESEINNFIQENVHFANKEVTISFGCKIFLSKSIRNATSHFVGLVKRHRTEEASLAYLDLMLILRRDLAYKLDRAKFSSLNASELGLVVFFRNVVYAKLQDYKKETRKLLVRLANQLKHDDELRIFFQSMGLNSKYGISDKDIKTINELLLKK